MAWSKYKEVQYGTVFPGSNLTDFPLLVKIAADSDIASECGSGGGIKFTSADGMTDLAFGLYPSSDITTGDIIARVKASPITSGTTGNPIVRLYYSASESTSENKAGVMDGNYEFFGVPGDYGSGDCLEDWVSETTFTGEGGLDNGELTSGVIDQSLDFTSTAHKINTGLTTHLDDFTIEIPCTFESNETGYWSAKWNNTGSGSTMLWGGDGGGGKSAFTVRTAGGSNQSVNTSSNTLRLTGTFGVALTRDSDGTAQIFIDGSLDNSGSLTSGSLMSNTTPWYIGATGTGTPTNSNTGKTHEWRLSSVVRSDDWLAYAYENDFNNSDTVTLGSEQGGGGAFTASASLSFSEFTFAGTATFSPGTKTASADLSFPAFTFAGTATYDSGTFTASASLSFSVFTFAGDATFSPGTKTASADLNFPLFAFAGNATFDSGTFTASAALGFSELVFAGAATFAEDTFTASADITFSAFTFAGDATFSPGTKTASADITFSSLTFSGSATFQKPEYTASADITFSVFTFAGTATFAEDSSVGSAALVFPEYIFTGDGTFSPGTKTASADVSFPVLTFLGSAAYDSGTFTGSANLTFPALTFIGDAAYTAPSGTGLLVNVLAHGLFLGTP